MNPQSKTWAGQFGDDYTRRAPGSVKANEELFQRALPWSVAKRIRTVVEFGAGTGANLRALKNLAIGAHHRGIEINAQAFDILRRDFPQSEHRDFLEQSGSEPLADLVLTKGCLIHIAPEDLPRAYSVIYRAAGRYILIAEYYCPTPRMIPYRGEDNLLWARDFAGELLDKFHPELRLLDYGFSYHRDRYPQDDLTWFLMEK